MAPELLIALAVAFVVVTGMNDGGALIAPGLRVPALSVPVSLAILTAAVVALPLLVSTAVADTMAGTIVAQEDDSPTALATGFLVAIVVVMSLAWAGLPTSLTLAVIGAIAGAGVGMDLAVEWASVTRVLGIGLAAPIVGMLLALAGSWVWRAARRASYLSTVRRSHTAAFVAQCVAYGANDGQKMLVLFMAVAAAGSGEQSVPWWAYLVIPAGFAIGSMLGLPKIARTVGNGILSTRPTHAVTAEFSAAAAVLGSAAAGAPVSMTQSIAGGLLGAGVHESYRRVRWRVVRNLVLAWVVTLPVSFGAAAVGGLIAASLS